MEIVTEDETWMHYFDPEKRNKVRVASDGERPVIARRNETVSKSFTLFSLMGMVHYFMVLFQRVRR